MTTVPLTAAQAEADEARVVGGCRDLRRRRSACPRGARLGPCEARHPTRMFTAPAQLQRLRELGDPRMHTELGRFRLIAHAGAPRPEPVKRLARRRGRRRGLGVLRLHSGPVHGVPRGHLRRAPGLGGRARPGRTLSADVDGTIWCTVPEHARFSYWNAPEKTAAAWRGDAFSVSDLGRPDDDGWLYAHLAVHRSTDPVSICAAGRPRPAAA